MGLIRSLENICDVAAFCSSVRESKDYLAHKIEQQSREIELLRARYLQFHHHCTTDSLTSSLTDSLTNSATNFTTTTIHQLLLPLPHD